MGNEVKVAWKGTTTTYKLAVDSWTSQGVDLLAAGGGLKAAATVSKMIPYVGMVLDLLDAVATDERLRQIENEIKRLWFVINDIYERLQAINVELALIDNIMKARELEGIASDLESITQKATEPDITPRDLKNFCIDLASLADKFLASGQSASSGQVLQFDLWRSAGFSTGPDTPQPVRDLFTTWPTLGLYALTLTTWSKLRERAMRAGEPLPKNDASARMRHMNALSTRPAFNRHASIDVTEEYTLLEFALLHVTDGFAANSRGRQCVLTAGVSDTMSGYFYQQDEAEFDRGANGFCQLDDFHIDSGSEPQMLDSIYEVAGIGLMRRLRTKMAAPPPVREFSVWPKAVDLLLYVVDVDDNLQQYTARALTDLTAPIVWERARERVGRGWGDFTAVVAVSSAELYAVRPDTSIASYRHLGQAEKQFRWADPLLIRDALPLADQVEHYLGSDDGSLYEVVLTPGGPGPDVGSFIPPTRHLFHFGSLANNEARLRSPTTLRLLRQPGYFGEPVWMEYVHMFAGDRGTFYGVDAQGNLFWHRHLRAGNSVEGPLPLGGGWRRYAHIFAAREGIIFGVTLDGDMWAHAFTQWDNLESLGRQPTELSDPVPVGAPGEWSSSRRFVPVLSDAPPSTGPK